MVNGSPNAVHPLCLALTNPITGIKRMTDHETMIEKHRNKDELSAARGDRFSRECGKCGKEDPPIRFISTSCCHAVCRECADGTTACKACVLPTTFIRMYEEDPSSRECLICLNPSPYHRVVFTECGHVVCACCAITISVSNNPNCVLCNVYISRMIIMREKVIKN